MLIVTRRLVSNLTPRSYWEWNAVKNDEKYDNGERAHFSNLEGESFWLHQI